MNIVVIGAGALGVYYGSRLEDAGAHVTYLVREGRVAQINNHGIKVTSTLGNLEPTEVNYTTNIEAIDSPDLVLVALKGYHLESALPQIKHFTDQGAYVLPLLNGIEHIETLQSFVGASAVIGGLAFIIATLDEKGHVHHTSDFHRLVFGPLMKGQEEFCQQLEELTTKAHLEAIHTPDVLYELWKKYMYITAFSGITTGLNEPIGILQGNEPTQNTVLAMLTEMQQLARGYNVVLSDKDVEETMENFLHLDQEATSSMHQDRRKGLRLEVDHLQGGAIRLAKERGIQIPTIQAIYGLIAPFEYPQ